MPRPNNYYEETLNRTSLPAAVDVPSSYIPEVPKLNPVITNATSSAAAGLPAVNSNTMSNINSASQAVEAKKESLGISQKQLDENVRRAVDKATYDSAILEKNRSLGSSFPYELANTIFNMPDQGYWENSMTPWEKTKLIATEIPKTAWNLIKALPGTIIKAPLNVSHGILEGESRLYNKLTGTRPEDNPMTVPPSYNLPILGEIKGFGGDYDEGIEMGLSPFASAVKATGEFAGDLAISASLVEAVGAAFKPRLSTVKKGVTGADFRPLQAQQIEQIKVGAGKKAITTGDTINFGEATQNPNISYFRLPKSAASKYGGNSNNTFLKLIPAGEGQAQISVVQIRKSLFDQAKDALANKFGAGKVSQGPLGPELKLESGIVKYNPSALTRQSTSLAPTAKTGTADLQTVLGNMGKATPATLEKQALKFDSAEEFISSQNNLNQTKEQFYLDDINKLASKYGNEPIYQANKGDDRFFARIADDHFNELSPETQQWLEFQAPGTDFESKNIPQYKGFANADEFTSTEGMVHGGQITQLKQAVENQILESSATIKTPEELTKIWNTSQQAKIDNVNNSRLIDPYTKARMAKKMPATAVEKGIPNELPSVMAKPLKGFENSLVNPKQTDQILGITAEKELSDVGLQAIIKTITGKDNLFELDQKEAYDVAETVRNFANDDNMPESDSSVILRSFTHPARYWMESAEREFGFPTYSEVFLPLETATRVLKVYSDRWMQKSREIFGKFADPKFAEERRLVNSYIEGNKGNIINNKALTPETKIELAKIGDWLNTTYKDLFELVGVKSTKYFGEYAPKIRQVGGISNLYKTSEMPAEIKPFFEFEREGMLQPLEDDALALFDIYTRAIGKKQFLAEPIKNATIIMGKMPENLQKATNDYVQEKLGYKDKAEEYLSGLSKKLSKNTNGYLPEDIIKQVIDYGMTASYAGALGLPRIMPILRNAVQPLLTTYPDIGPTWFAEGVRRYTKKGSLQKLRDKGFLVEMGVPYGADLSSKAHKGIVGKAFDFYETLNKTMMKPYAWSDNLSRGITYYGVEARLEDSWSKFLEGKTDYPQFERDIDMAGFNPTLRKILNQKFSNSLQGKPEAMEEAKNLMAMDILDRTQFPYRKGSESRAFYGLKGKLGLQFAQWPVEYAFTLKSWVARGQWEKVVRWFGVSAAITKSIEDNSNVDVKDWMGWGPFNGMPLGPLAQVGMSAIAGIKASASDMDSEVNKNWNDITRSLRIYGGVLSGVGAQRIKNFWNSVERYESGIIVSTDADPEKKFGVWSTNGKLIRWVDFSELLQTLMGFNSKSGVEQSERISTVQKKTVEYNNQMNKAMNYLIDGNYNKFDKTVTNNNIMIPDIATKMKSYYIPLDQRIFERLPLELKSKYFNVFYPME